MPAEQFFVNINRPIQSVIITDNPCQEVGNSCQGSAGTELLSLNTELQQKAVLSQAAQALNAAAVKFRQFYDSAVAKYKEDIARLSVEIARKILAQKV